MRRLRQQVRLEGLAQQRRLPEGHLAYNHKFECQKCTTPTLTQDEIKELFLRAANQVIDQKEQFIAIYKLIFAKILDTAALESELSGLEAEINIAADSSKSASGKTPMLPLIRRSTKNATTLWSQG